MTDQQFPPSSTGPVTFDDVAHALGDLDPGHTNAAKLRETLGRGSFATIQKHLDRLRASKAAQEPAPGSEVPSAPADVLVTLWSAAYRAASHLTSSGITRTAGSLRGLEMMPAVVILIGGSAAGIKQELPVALGSEDRTLDDISLEAVRFHGGADAAAGGLMQLRFAHDAAFADLSALHFELRLYQQNHHALG